MTARVQEMQADRAAVGDPSASTGDLARRKAPLTLKKKITKTMMTAAGAFMGGGPPPALDRVSGTAG